MNSYHLRLDPKSLVPADDNPQRMTPTMFNNLKTALAADTDTIDEPAVWKDGDHYRIISGHHRVKAATELGWSEVSVKVFDDPTCNELWYRSRILSVNHTHGDANSQALRDFIERTSYLDDFDIKRFAESSSFTVKDIDTFVNDSDQYEEPIVYPTEYLVVIECSNEGEQNKIYSELNSRGLTCKII